MSSGSDSYWKLKKKLHRKQLVTMRLLSVLKKLIGKDFKLSEEFWA